MRTTIEIRDDLRAKLLDLAARRGEKGFSRLVEEALDLYVGTEEAREAARRQALMVRSSLATDEADKLEERTRTIREEWR